MGNSRGSHNSSDVLRMGAELASIRQRGLAGDRFGGSPVMSFAVRGRAFACRCGVRRVPLARGCGSFSFLVLVGAMSAVR